VHICVRGSQSLAEAGVSTGSSISTGSPARGRYKGGEDGSPIVALKAALSALNAQIKVPYEFHFVELEPPIAAALAANVEYLKQHRVVPPSIELFIHKHMTFEEAYRQHLRARLRAHPRAPAFALVDPFGWTGIPMSILGELVRRPSTEILVNFMFEEINRFLFHPAQVANFDTLFACADWRRGGEMRGLTRKQFIHDLYRDQLRQAAGARYVRSFEMRNERNVCDYFLYFASNNRLGLEKMKEAMWKVDPAGGFTFSDATNLDQAVLFQAEPDRRALRRLISGQFAGRRATVNEVNTFVIEDTPFHGGHYRKVLAAMEKDGELTPVNPPPNRRRGTYADPSLALEFSIKGAP
jgi:three-Cys-motif partner protein